MKFHINKVQITLNNSDGKLGFQHDGGLGSDPSKTHSKKVKIIKVFQEFRIFWYQKFPIKQICYYLIGTFFLHQKYFFYILLKFWKNICIFSDFIKVQIFGFFLQNSKHLYQNVDRNRSIFSEPTKRFEKDFILKKIINN